jgi:CRP-like cAMP-binding protein
MRVRHLVERLDDRVRSVRSRLAEFFLDRAATSRTPDSISLGMTQQALAEELGTVREVVSRELKALVSSGTVESLGGGRFRVADVDALRRRASEERHI